MAVVSEQAARSNQAVADYRRANGLVELTDAGDSARRTPITEQLASQLRDFSAALSAQAQAEVRLTQLRDLKADPQKALSSTEVAGSEIMRDLYNQEASVRQRIAELGAFSDRHPRKLALKSELDDVRTRIRAQTTRVLDAATQDYERASAVVDRLSKEVARQQERAVNEQAERVKLAELERRARIDENLHTAFMQSTQEAIERSSWHEPNVQLIARAVPPERPVFPNKRVILPIGLVGSISLASLAGIAVELRRRNRGFIDPTDLEDSTGLQVNGVIPWSRRPTAFPAPDEITLAVEAIGMRLLFNSIREGDDDRRAPGWVVAITSSCQGEGKSVLSLNVAAGWRASGSTPCC